MRGKAGRRMRGTGTDWTWPRIGAALAVCAAVGLLVALLHGLVLAPNGLGIGRAAGGVAGVLGVLAVARLARRWRDGGGP